MGKEIFKKIPAMLLFDLDETLCESKTLIDAEMVELLTKLLSKTKVAIISGGKFERLKEQVFQPLRGKEKFFHNLFVFPTMGGCLYLYKDNFWQEMYKREIPAEDRRKIIEVLKMAVIKSGLSFPERLYGEQIEIKSSQVTFSALGQEAPLAEKRAWDPDVKKRILLKQIVEKIGLPENYQIFVGGATSLDIVLKGIDKNFAVKQASFYSGITIQEMLFIGDRLQPEGNDYSVVQSGIATLAVNSVEETKQIIKNILEVGS